MTIDKLLVELVSILTQLPLTQTFTGRTLLLDGIRGAELIQRDPNNVLIDIQYCVNTTRNMYQDEKWSLLRIIDNALPSVRGSDFDRRLQYVRNQLQTRRWPIHQVLEPFRFDLDTLVDECVRHLPSQPSLIGYLVPCRSERFLKNFCYRISDELRWRKIIVRELIKVDVLHTNVKFVMEKRLGKFEEVLRSSSILQPIEVVGAVDAENLWRNLTQKYSGFLPNHLIFLIGLAEEWEQPENVKRLTYPRFHETHVHKWVWSIVSSLEWPHEFVPEWAEYIIRECQLEDEINIDFLYEHIEVDVPELFRRTNVFEEFRQIISRP